MPICTRQGNRDLDVVRNKKTAEKKYSKKEPEAIGSIIEWEELLPIAVISVELEPAVPVELENPLKVQSAPAAESKQSPEEELESELMTKNGKDMNRRKMPFTEKILLFRTLKTRREGQIVQPEDFCRNNFVGMVMVDEEEQPLFDVVVKHQPMVFGSKIQKELAEEENRG